MLLNLDAGEHDDEPEELWRLFDVLNTACGGHAGDAASMTRVAEFCAHHPHIHIGAHPSYPERANFGRTTMPLAPEALKASITEQCAALSTVARASGLTVAWIKPHGALYHDAATREPIARAVVDGAIAALGTQITVIGPPKGMLRGIVLARGVRYAREGFADRRMRDDGSLVSRSEPDALIVDPTDAAAQAVTLAQRVDTICVHADTPGALTIAGAVREALRC